MTLISIDPQIVQFAVQPHELIYWMPGPDGAPVKRRYIPDVVALDRAGRVLILEAKAGAFASQEKWTDRHSYIREAYAQDHGAVHLLFTEQEIHAQPRLSNAQIIHTHRGPPKDEEADMVMAQIVENADCTLMLGQLCLLGEEHGLDERRSFSALMRLVMRGSVCLDMSAAISASSRVSLSGAR